MKRQKILWLSHFVPYPPDIGAVQRSYNLLREVAQYHDIILLAFNQPALLKNEAQIKKSLDHLNVFCEVADVIPIKSEQTSHGRKLAYLYSLFSKEPFTTRWLESDEFSKRIKQIIKSHSVDAVHFDTISFAPYLSATGNTKTVLNHHNIESDMMLRRASQDSNLLKRLYLQIEGRKLRRIEKLWCPRFDMNVTCSPLDTERLLENIPELRKDKVDVIPNGVDPDRFSNPTRSEKNNTLIFAGGMGWYPNQAAMFFFADHVWPILKKQNPEVQMFVIGPQPPKRLIELSESDPSFKVTGFVDDVRPYIEEAAVYVCPIFDGGGTKLKVLEALAMSKALVAHPIACEGIDVIDGESVVFAETPEQFATQITLLLQDQEKRKRLGAEGKKLALDKYSYKSIGLKLAGIYNKITHTD